MNINWTLRFKQWDFTFGIIILFFGINQINFKDLTSWEALLNVFENFIKNPYLIIYFILNLVGYIRDWTTKGLCDSKNALEYRNLK